MTKQMLLDALADMPDNSEVLVNTKTVADGNNYSWWDFKVDKTPSGVSGEAGLVILQPSQFAGG